MLIQQFRKAVHQSVVKWDDPLFDLLDALTNVGHVELPVALSEDKTFQNGPKLSFCKSIKPFLVYSLWW